MRSRVVAGTDRVSALLRTIDTAACDTPAAAAMSFCVGRSELRLLSLTSPSYIACRSSRLTAQGVLVIRITKGNQQASHCGEEAAHAAVTSPAVCGGSFPRAPVAAAAFRCPGR